MNELKELRMHCKFSVKELAQAIGVSAVTLSSWERGKTTPSFLNSQLLKTFFDEFYKDKIQGHPYAEELYFLVFGDLVEYEQLTFKQRNYSKRIDWKSWFEKQEAFPLIYVPSHNDDFYTHAMIFSPEINAIIEHYAIKEPHVDIMLQTEYCIEFKYRSKVSFELLWRKISSHPQTTIVIRTFLRMSSSYEVHIYEDGKGEAQFRFDNLEHATRALMYTLTDPINEKYKEE